MSHEWWNVVGVYSQGSANTIWERPCLRGGGFFRDDGSTERRRGKRLARAGEALPVTIDFEDIELRHAVATSKAGWLSLIRFMKLRNEATFQELIDDAYGGQELAEPTIRSYVSQANNYLLGDQLKTLVRDYLAPR